MKCLFLYNPKSGKGKIGKHIGYIRKRLEKKYDTVDIVPTASAEDLTERVRAGAEEYDAIIFSGGDGTFNNVLQGVGEKDVRLGYLPTGTANDVAHSLGITRSLRGALKVILKGHEDSVDCMRVNGDRYVMYVAAAGTLTHVTYETPQDHKRALGWFAYFFQGIRKNLKLEVFPMEGTCGEKTFSEDGVLIFIMNGRSIAGFPINKEASMQDGILEVAIIRQAKRPNLLQRIGAYFSLATLMVFGVRIKKKDIRFLHGDRVQISTKEHIVWDFDGEEGIKGDITVEVLPRRVHLFVPAKKKL